MPAQRDRALRAEGTGREDRGRGAQGPRTQATRPVAEQQVSPKRVSPHYRRAQRDRGAETRAQLIEAALDIFGRFGFEGASTRMIAKAAGANLAAIVYHFGSKEALHIAVAEHVVSQITGAMAPFLARAAEPESSATPQAARATYIQLIEAYIDVMIGSAEAARWARFIVREQMQPSGAFEVIVRTMGNAIGLAGRLVATALGVPESEETRLRAFAIFGQVLIFRVAQPLVLRRLEWEEIGAPERAKIKRIVAQHVEAILSSGGAA